MRATAADTPVDETSIPAPAAVIVLAAGEGTRMKSAVPKVLHTIAGRSMIGHALAAAHALAPERVAVVVRHGRDQVAAHVEEIDPNALIVDQDDVPGTGRAVECALEALDARVFAEAGARDELRDHDPSAGGPRLAGSVVVMAADVPLLDGGTLGELVAAHEANADAVTILTTMVADPTGYGRIVREEGTGDVLRIVEHRDAGPEERAIHEINSSVYVFEADVLRRGLGAVNRDNAQNEVYLTDVAALAHAEGGAVRAVRAEDPLVVEGVNDRVQLAVLRAEFNRRLLEEWMRAGVTVVDPSTTWVDVDVELAQDVTLLPNTQLQGATVVGVGATIGPDTTLTDMEIGAGATIIRTHASLSVIGAGACVGPFAYLRPNTRLGDSGKIGTFVETKNSQIGTGTKVPHLSYVGDATIGEYTNIGAASVTVNYDGVHKYPTVIGSHARTGADNMFVAPVTVGDGAYTGAGSTIRRDVPPGALAVSGGSQRNIEGWVARRRPGTPAAEAAARALAAEGAVAAQAQAQLADHRAASGTDGPPTSGASDPRQDPDQPAK